MYLSIYLFQIDRWDGELDMQLWDGATCKLCTASTAKIAGEDHLRGVVFGFVWPTLCRPCQNE